MNILLVDNGSEHTNKIVDFFGGNDIEVIAPTDQHLEKTPTDTLVVLSGSSDTSLYGHEGLYQQEIEFIQNFPGAIIGICLGFQLIAHAHGARLHKMEEKRRGVVRITATHEGELLLPEKSLEVYKGHRWRIREVDHPLVVMARSEDGIEIIQHASRPLYGVQFHPEVVNGNDGGIILRRIVDLATAKIKHKHDII